MTDAKKMALLACEALEDKKASDIKELTDQMFSYALVSEEQETPDMSWLSTGYSSANWILLDYGDIVIHLFDEENRLFYDLERIWRDGKVMDAKELKEEQ